MHKVFQFGQTVLYFLSRRFAVVILFTFCLSLAIAGSIPSIFSQSHFMQENKAASYRNPLYQTGMVDSTAVVFDENKEEPLITPTKTPTPTEKLNNELRITNDGNRTQTTTTPTPTRSATSTPTAHPINIPTTTPTNTPVPTLTPSPTPVPVQTIDPNSEEIWNKIAECESHQNWNIDTGNGYFGGLQFSQGAWESVGGTGNPAQASREEQIAKGKLLQQKRGWGVWGACAKQLGL